jgi:isoquinoline 1-oxidoreductase subunit alpha
MIVLKINGSEKTFTGDPQMPLLWYLRDELGLYGAKFGCGMGLCAACTVGARAIACGTLEEMPLDADSDKHNSHNLVPTVPC